MGIETGIMRKKRGKARKDEGKLGVKETSWNMSGSWEKETAFVPFPVAMH